MSRALLRLVVGIGIVAVWLSSQGGHAQAPAFAPVTDAVLQDPDPADWLNFRRTLDGWGYSPLDQITRENVGTLRLVWSWALEPGSQQTTPLVYDGVMYIANPGGIVQALDAATGEFLWEYRPAEPTPTAGGQTTRRPTGGPVRNLAIYQDKIIVNTSDAHVVALDAGTGDAVWDTTVAEGYRYTSGSIVANGKVISGLTGCGRYRDDTCYVVGLDATTGQELWRTSTIARPGEPGGDTWGDLPLMFRAGADAWIPGSYDPETDLVYWGTAQAKPWASAVRGTDGAALYSNSTLALDPDTGEMKWYYQHLPAESHDMDESLERILIDYDGRRSVFTVGKIGILWELDRVSGRFVNAHDLGYQTIVDLDRTTGHVAFRPGLIPEIGKPVDFCPSTAGFKSWRAVGYHPGTEAFYIPLNLTCETGIFGLVEKREGGGGAGPVRRTNHFHPKSPDHLGELLAIDLRTGNVRWRHRVRTPFGTSALTTGGGLVFAGDWDRYFYAYDAETGEILFQTRMPTSTQGFPVTYAVGGKQFVTIPVGQGGASWGTLLPRELTPDKVIPRSGNSLFVFALPDNP